MAEVKKCPKGHLNIQRSGAHGEGASSEVGLPPLTHKSYYCYTCMKTYDERECIE